MRTAHTWVLARVGDAGHRKCGGYQVGLLRNGGRTQNPKSRGTELYLKEVGGRPVPTQLGEAVALVGCLAPFPSPLPSFWCLSPWAA